VLKGYWWDKYTYRDGRVVVTEPRENAFADNGKVLLAQLLAEPFFAQSLQGTLFHAFGSLLASHDVTPIPVDPTQTTLTTEFFRKTPDAVTDQLSGIVIGGKSNTVKYSTTLYFGEGNGDIREQGLFGGDATGTQDSGFLIDIIHHAKIVKTGAFQLTRFIQIEI